jgi:hypothetical protein
VSVKTTPLPSATKITKTIDDAARRSLQRAQRTMNAVVAAEAPGSGPVERALQPRVSQTTTGHQLVIGPSRGARHPSGATIAQVIRWNNRGTGVLRIGPGPKNVIHSPRWFFGDAMILPGGVRRLTVKGQRANPYMERIGRAGDLRVGQTVAQGAEAVMIEVGRELS